MSKSFHKPHSSEDVDTRSKEEEFEIRTWLFRFVAKNISKNSIILAGMFMIFSVVMVVLLKVL